MATIPTTPLLLVLGIHRLALTLIAKKETIPTTRTTQKREIAMAAIKEGEENQNLEMHQNQIIAAALARLVLPKCVQFLPEIVQQLQQLLLWNGYSQLPLTVQRRRQKGVVGYSWSLLFLVLHLPKIFVCSLIVFRLLVYHADKPSLKRKSQESVETDGGGYNSDDEDRTTEASETANEPNSMMEEADTPTSSDVAAEEGTQKGGGKKRKVAEMKREERNAREKERSFRISKQINELRNLLSSGGVIVPKGTKSSVLTEAANYIRMLQQHQYRSEM